MADNPKLRMARRIAEKHADSVRECLFGHTASQTVRRVLEDGLAQAALATIEECTERAAKLAIGWRDENKSSIDDGDQSIAAQKVRGAAIEMNAFARALRSGDHLKGPTDDDDL